jgi:hypothetical protein
MLMPAQIQNIDGGNMKQNLGWGKSMRHFGNTSYIIGVAFIIASILASAIPPTVVSAHHANVSGSATCQSDGTYKINWSVSNWDDIHGPMTLTDINRSIGIDVGSQINASGVTGSEIVSNQKTTITLTVSGSWTWPDGSATSTNSGSVKLDGKCYPPPPPNTPTNTPTNTPDIPANTPTDTPTKTPITPPDYQLNLSHIACVDGRVEIHFVLLNVPDGTTPGTLTYTYGSISPSKHTGNVWHYFDYKPDGTYNVTSASVDVGGTTVSLHNPGTDSGTYLCSPTKTPVTPSKTPSDTPTNTPTNTSTYTPTNTPTITPTSTSTKEGERTICHVAGLANDPANFIILTLPLQAIYAGHIDENGTPKAGHEQDFFINSPEDAARCAPPTPTATPTNAPTDTPTHTPTFTPTNTPTATSSITPPFHDPFSLEFYCTGFTVVNNNDFQASYEWNISGGPSGTGLLQPFGSFAYDTAYYPGVVSLYSGGVLMAAGYLPTNCGKDEKTPTPPVRTPRTPVPTRTPHDPTKVVKTLIPPVITTPDILIPVTGVDLGGSNSLQRMLFSLGLSFLGLGLVLNGLARNRKDLGI